MEIIKNEQDNLMENPNLYEIFFALVGAVGTDLTQIAEILSDCLKEVNFRPEIINLSSLLQGIEDS